MSIFNQITKTDLEKLGVLSIEPFKKNGRWLFKKDNRIYDLAPAQITDVTFSPTIVGVDRLVSAGCEFKKIPNYESGFRLLISKEWFPGCDVKLDYLEDKYDGWLYEISSENMTGVMEGQKAWICPYMKFFYQDTPKTLFIKMEQKS